MKRYRHIPFLLFLLLAMNEVDLFGITSGPKQPETQQFAPVTASELVNIFTGNFSYNIPLFELPGPNGGYPFNINYMSGVTMDQEASWIGLGWNLNIGAITRQMRTLPDEFNGSDFIKKKVDQLDNSTIGMGMVFDYEIAGTDAMNDIAKISPSAGVSMYFNSYRGFGFATDIGVGVTFPQIGASIGVSLKNDNQEGATFSPSLSLGYSREVGQCSVGGSLNLGLNYNSNMGLQNISLGGGMSVSNKNNNNNTKAEVGESKNNNWSQGISQTATMSFNNSFITSPSIKNSTKTTTFSGFFKISGVVYGNQMGLGIHGDYTKESIIDKMKDRLYPAYGYLNLQKGQNDENAALDFIREKDATLHKDIRNLAAPVLTYDIYSVTGQGFSGMFRPYRSDIGAVNDKTESCSTDGVNVALDASIGNLFQVGFSLNFPTMDSKSQKWKGATPGSIHDKYSFTDFKSNSLDEPYRFQLYGEKNVTDKSQISNLIGGFGPSYVSITGTTTNDIDYTTKSRLGNISNQLSDITTNKLNSRNSRQTDIKAIENKYLYDGSLPECNAYFIEKSTNKLDTLDRDDNQALYKAHHIGAFIVTTSDGTRYIYGLPVYNIKQVENSFSTAFGNNADPDLRILKDLNNKIPDNEFEVSGSDVKHTSNDNQNFGFENYERTEIPGYTYAHLLTAIIGPDYVDVNGDGVSDDDLGYFVKFIYLKSDSIYKWRAPFTTANYIEGQHAIDADNMGTYNYGERETYYLYSAETKSHKVQFYIGDNRVDARGAKDEFQKGSILGAKSYKLDSLSLFSKLDQSKPIKNVYFQYNKYDYNANRFWVDKDSNRNELCGKVENAMSGRGKLTLKAVYSTYGENEKGLKNPYIFNYNENDTFQNPNYDSYSYDRWGSYQQTKTSPTMLPIKYFPYTRQDNEVDLETKNRWSSAWCLKDIILPSGAKLAIDYEADRYAYVQNKPAMEMYKMEGINTDELKTGVDRFVLKKNPDHPDSNANYVTFKLKRPIVSEDASEQQKELAKYLDYTNQLYYKIYIDLNGDNQWEFVTGYADIHSVEYVNDTIARIRLKSIDLQVGKNPHRPEHPFSLATWNYVQANRPELLNENSNGPLESRGRSSGEIMGIINTALSALNPLAALVKFKDFYKKAADEGWGQIIDYDKSYIRLNSYLSPIENNIVEKFGGDSRVKSVKVFENKSADAELVTGQYYDYTDSIPGTGLLISTGVAANEPSIGGDESALRFGKIGFLEPKFKTNRLQFQEMPMNESYMPAPDVGYSKVTIKSIATKGVLSGALSPTIPTTGISVNEFYTAKDYPTIYDETQLSQNAGTLLYKQPKLAFRPLGGMITESNLGATQGYYTVINDMHGKEKKTSFYGISSAGKVISTPISYVEYRYKSNTVWDVRGLHYELDNEVPVIYNHLGALENKLIGVDVENFIDTRQSHTRSESEGGRFNLSVMMFGPYPIPLPTYFPDLGYDQRRSYTCVDNKIVHRFGILNKTIVYKEGALTTTDNLVYDGYTGTPLLASYNNEFNDTIYNYNIPAHLIYANMGQSYKTDNLIATGTVEDLDTTRQQLSISVPQFENVSDYLKEGDELLVKSTYEDPYSDPEDASTESEYGRCYIMRVDNDNKLIWVQSENGIAPGFAGSTTMYMFRPYSRNILTGQAGTIVSKNNPLKDKMEFDCK